MKCWNCTSNALPGSKRCATHRMEAALRRTDLSRLDSANRRAAYDAQDLCVQCGDPKDPNSKSNCRRCLDRNTAAFRARRKKGS